MAVATQPVPPAIEKSAVMPTDFIWRLSVDQYHEMIRAGILTENAPVELLEGWLVTKMPKTPPHSVTTQLTRETLARMLPAGWYVDCHEPITTADSEPEPDVAVVRGDTRQYFDRHPGPQDVALVAEVSDATLRHDQGFKKRVYASAGIPVYWIINLVDNRCEVYTHPSGPAEQPDYRQRQDYGPSNAIPFMFENVEVGRIATQDLLP